MEKLIQKGNDLKLYDSLTYESKKNFISYYNQYRLIIKQKPKSILELGVGTKLLSAYLKERNFKVTTCDFDTHLKPDVVADVRDLPFTNNSFDVVVSFEVLEHLPFKYFKKCLLELKRCSKSKIIISLPYASFNIFGSLKFLPFVAEKFFLFRFNLLSFFKHKFKGSHYWEIGKKNYSLGRIRKKIRSAGLKIEEEFCDKQNPSHYFFVLKKT
jgi:SAM-dependent methyltransferase